MHNKSLQILLLCMTCFASRFACLKSHLFDVNFEDLFELDVFHSNSDRILYEHTLARRSPFVFSQLGNKHYAGGEEDGADSTNISVVNCGESSDDFIVQKISIKPFFLTRGKRFRVRASGRVSKKINDGSFVDVEVAFQNFSLFKTRINLCKEIASLPANAINPPSKRKCPLMPGAVLFGTQEVIPRYVPPVSQQFV